MNNLEKPSSDSEEENNFHKENREENREEEEEEVFDKLSKKRNTNLFEKYAEKMELGDDLKESAYRYLSTEADEATEEFINNWTTNNREKIKNEKGIDPKKLDIAAKFQLCNEQGGFEELKTNAQYQEQYDKTKNIDMLLYEVKQENVPIDSQFLILNRLNHRAENIEKGLNQKRYEAREAIAKRAELEELLRVTQEIGQKLTKGDLGKIAEEKGLKTLMNSLGNKEDYIKNRFSLEKDDYINKRLEREFGGTKKAEEYLRFLGYKMKRKGFLKKRTIITDRNGVIVRRFTKQKEALQFLKAQEKTKTEERLEKELRAGIGKEWEDSKAAEIRKAIRREVKGLASSPEKAEKSLGDLYQEARQKLIQEFKEKKFKKENIGNHRKKKEKAGGGKKRKRNQNQEKGADNVGEGESMAKTINDLLNKEGAFRDLGGIWKTDKKIIENFCDSMDVPTTHLDSVEKGMREKGIVYEKRHGLGLVAFLMEFLVELMQSVLGEEKEKSKK